MSPIKKIYQAELRRIRRSGIKVHPSSGTLFVLSWLGFECDGCFMPPNTIYIDEKIKTTCHRLCILLHEEYHSMDKRLNDSTFLREYRAQRYVTQKVLALKSKLLTRQVIANTRSWLDWQGDKKNHLYYCAAKKLMKTKLWKQLCQN